MKRVPLLWSSAVLLSFAVSCGGAQESTVYATVVATKNFVVGAANPQTGLFFQHPSQDTLWDHAGPTNIRAFGCAAHPGTDGRVLYIASGNGLHRSGDGGRTWRVTTSWQVTEVLWVAPDPRDTAVVYIGTPYGIFATRDGCLTWSAASQGLRSQFVRCVIVDRVDSRRLYCATEDGAYTSADAGATWTRMTLSVGGVTTIAQHPRDPMILAAGTEQYGIYMTRNGGRWWDRMESGVDHQTFYVIAFDPTAPDVVYAAGYVTGVYKSTDGGLRWRRMNAGLSDLTFHTLAVDPRNGQRVYAGAHGGGLFRTDDGGEHWRFVGRPLAQVWHIDIRP
jgi:photosystem II stability/assembly factor-like uncharacterized protein